MGECEMIDISTGEGINIDRDDNKRVGQYDNCEWCNKLFEVALMRKWSLDDEWGYICKGCDAR